MRVALVNTNRMQPPIAPIGLDYVSEALLESGHDVEILDLCWETDPHSATRRFFDNADFGLVGLTLRNTDDCGFTTRHSFLNEFTELAGLIRSQTKAFLVLGGVGFSVMPLEILSLTNADAGIWGDGEFALPALAHMLESRQEWRGLPNLVFRHANGWRRNPPEARPLDELPSMRRLSIDNPRYFRHGGQIGFETKRGCPGQCTYCADPVAKGRQTRCRPPAAVADEVEALLGQGIDHFHTCDGEFNLPESHAIEVCHELSRRGLGDRLRWYAYCAPAPFSQTLAKAMRDAGCAGINFGVDSGDETMLQRLRRGFGPAEILDASRAANEAGIAVMLDLLLGAPGESRASLVRTIELAKASHADRVGVSVGVRLYPGTALYEQFSRRPAPTGLHGGTTTADPLYFLEPTVAPFIFDLLDSLIAGDERFLFFDPSRAERNYNYDENQRLVAAIRQGYRGAYWDILRRFG